MCQNRIQVTPFFFKLCLQEIHVFHLVSACAGHINIFHSQIKYSTPSFFNREEALEAVLSGCNFCREDPKKKRNYTLVLNIYKKDLRLYEENTIRSFNSAVALSKRRDTTTIDEAEDYAT
jgi:hypothetical protein